MLVKYHELDAAVENNKMKSRYMMSLLCLCKLSQV